MNIIVYINVSAISIILLLDLLGVLHKPKKLMYMWIGITICQIADYIYYPKMLWVYILLWAYSIFAIKTAYKYSKSIKS